MDYNYKGVVLLEVIAPVHEISPQGMFPTIKKHFISQSTNSVRRCPSITTKRNLILFEYVFRWDTFTILYTFTYRSIHRTRPSNHVDCVGTWINACQYVMAWYQFEIMYMVSDLSSELSYIWAGSENILISGMVWCHATSLLPTESIHVQYFVQLSTRIWPPRITAWDENNNNNCIAKLT